MCNNFSNVYEVRCDSVNYDYTHKNLIVNNINHISRVTSETSKEYNVWLGDGFLERCIYKIIGYCLFGMYLKDINGDENQVGGFIINMDFDKTDVFKKCDSTTRDEFMNLKYMVIPYVRDYRLKKLFGESYE